MTTPPKQLQTSRLKLRMPALQDAEAIFAEYAQDADLTRFLTWKPHKNLSETKDFLQRCLTAWEKGKEFTWVISFAEKDQAIGMISLRLETFKGELGYVLSQKYWGQGIMTEALHAIIDWAEKEPGVFRIWAVCDVENIASARVMQKVGMEKEGLLHRWIILPNLGDIPRDCFCYAKIT